MTNAERQALFEKYKPKPIYHPILGKYPAPIPFPNKTLENRSPYGCKECAKLKINVDMKFKYAVGVFAIWECPRCVRQVWLKA